MLRALVLFLSLLVLQYEGMSQVRYGIKGGLNISDVVINNVLDPDAESDYNLKLGPHAGMFFSADGERTGFGLELLYSNKGVRAITNTHFHYINIPILGRYHITEKLIGEAGPEIGYLVNARSRYGNLNDVWDNKIDVGLDLGLQYHFLPKVVAGIRFNAGISSVIRNAYGPDNERIRYQNRVLLVSIGYVMNEID